MRGIQFGPNTQNTRYFLVHIFVGRGGSCLSLRKCWSLLVSASIPWNQTTMPVLECLRPMRPNRFHLSGSKRIGIVPCRITPPQFFDVVSLDPFGGPAVSTAIKVHLFPVGLACYQLLADSRPANRLDIRANVHKYQSLTNCDGTRGACYKSDYNFLMDST